MIQKDQLEELTISEAQVGLISGAFTARELVASYLERIEANDQSGPSYNAFVTVSSTVLEDADALDEHLREAGELIGPLHGVPIAVKDQAETAGLRTTFGNASSGNYIPEKDSTAVAKLRAAGALILGKTAMPDFATSWFSTSSQTGVTRNPYSLSRDAGGSSSGTAAAVAANLALVGVGEDTGGSIRLPASFCNLVGLRVTTGLISRAGMSPLVTPQDTPGPLARTVTDCARMLDCMTGYDSADSYTAANAIARHHGSYVAAAENNNLAARRIGVLRQAFGNSDDPEEAPVNKVCDQALDKLKSAGAKLIDVEIADLEYYVGFTSLYYTRSREDIDAFLTSRPELGIESVEELYANKKFHEKLDLFIGIATGPKKASDDPEYAARLVALGDFQRQVAGLMAEQKLDAICFPDTKLAAPTHDDIFADRWTCLTYPTNTIIASQLQYPAISLPVGFTSNGLPVGLEFMTLPYDEPRLLGLARGVEIIAGQRRIPD